MTSFRAITLSLSTTEGQGSGLFSLAYSGEVFLMIVISTANSFATRPAASLLDNQRFPIGSLAYSVILCFFINLTSPFTWISSLFRHRTARRCGNIFCIFFFQELKHVGDERFFKEVALEPSVNEEIDDSVRPEEGQMLRYVWLADIEGVFEIAYAFHTLSKLFENLDAYGVGDDFEEIDSFLDRYHIDAFSLNIHGWKTSILNNTH